MLSRSLSIAVFRLIGVVAMVGFRFRFGSFTTVYSTMSTL